MRRVIALIRTWLGRMYAVPSTWDLASMTTPTHYSRCCLTKQSSLACALLPIASLDHRPVMSPLARYKGRSAYSSVMSVSCDYTWYQIAA